MENPGLVTFTEDYIFVSGATEDDLEGRTNTICHEMAHMWFGDLVTMKWWDDLWLNGIASQTSWVPWVLREANHFEDAWVTFANNRKAWAYMQDQLPTTHPIVADIPTWKPQRRTSTASPTPRAPRSLKQLVAYVGFGHLHRSRPRVLQALRMGQHLP